MSQSIPRTTILDNPILSRRRFFGRAVGAATLLSAAGLLAACGGPTGTATQPTVGGAATPAQSTPGLATGQARPTTGATAVAAGQPRRGGTLRVAYQGSAKHMDPARPLSVEDENLAFAVYNGLTRVDPQMKVQPDLATSWDASDDLKTWTFELRQGVKFHHGKVFNADDVVFSFTRVLDPKLASPGRSILNFLEGVEKKDDSTAVFHLKQAYADLPVVVGADIFGRIVPSDRDDDQILKEPSGTGPFKFQENVIGDHLTMVRNPDYWQAGLPYLDGIRQVTMPEQAGRDAALSGGQIDMIWQVYPTSVATLKQSPNVKLYQASSGGYVPLVMRSDRPPFDDVRVRQAMKYVVDREQVRQVVMLGLGDLANDQPTPPVLPLYTDIGMRKPDVARAKQLLGEAGHPNGLDLTLYTSPGRPGMVELAVAFQQMAAPAGIRVKIQKVPIDSYWADYWMKKDFCASNWLLRSTIDEILSVAYKSDAQWNEAFWKSPKLDDLILAGRSERDESKRKEIYARAARLISDEGGSIIAYFQPVISAATTALQGFDEPPLSLFDPRSVWLAK